MLVYCWHNPLPIKQFAYYLGFCYQSYLLYLVLYYTGSHFWHLELKTNDEFQNPCSVIEWTQMVRTKSRNRGFHDFFNKFMHHVYINFNGNPPPRIFPKCMNLLQLCPDTKVDDWFLFKNHIIISVWFTVKAFSITNILDT